MKSIASCAVYAIPGVDHKVLVDYQHVAGCPWRWELVPVTEPGWVPSRYRSTDDLARYVDKRIPSIAAALEVARAVDANATSAVAIPQPMLESGYDQGLREPWPDHPTLDLGDLT